LFSEVGVDSLGTPGLVHSPAQSFLDEEFVDASTLHANVFLLVEGGFQSIEGPTGEWQAQGLGFGQGGRDHYADLLYSGGDLCSRDHPKLLVVRTVGRSPAILPAGASPCHRFTFV
jgi:hypothetical protein